MPSRAKANTVFFCASVLSTWPLSPVVCAAAKSPRRAELTSRSPSRTGWARGRSPCAHSLRCRWPGCCTWNEELRPAVGRVAERGEQQRDVVVLGGLADGEGQHH